MLSVLPSEILLSDEYPPPPNPTSPTSSPSFLCSQTPLRQGYKIADLLWFTCAGMRQTWWGWGGVGGGARLCVRETEDSLSNSAGPLILPLERTSFPQNLCILPRAREIRRWGGKGVTRGKDELRIQRFSWERAGHAEGERERVEKSGIRHKKRFEQHGSSRCPEV